MPVITEIRSFVVLRELFGKFLFLRARERKHSGILRDHCSRDVMCALLRVVFLLAAVAGADETIPIQESPPTPHLAPSIRVAEIRFCTKTLLLFHLTPHSLAP